MFSHHLDSAERRSRTLALELVPPVWPQHGTHQDTMAPAISPKYNRCRAPQNTPAMPYLARITPIHAYHGSSCPGQASSLWRTLGLPLPTLLWPSYEDGPKQNGPCPQVQDSYSSVQPAKVTRPHSLHRGDHIPDHSFKWRSSCSP